jgi:hypothetical protein
MARRRRDESESEGGGDRMKELAKLLRANAGSPLAIQAIADQMDPPEPPEEEEAEEDSTEQ